jgi:predicted CXXCH cytochrome family protein
MELLLRRSIGGGQETVDHDLSGDRLRLGDSTDCDFHLPGLPAAIEVTDAGDGALRLKSEGAPFLRSGTATDRLTLRPGDELVFAGLEVRVIPAPAGFDAALELGGSVERAAPFADAGSSPGIRPVRRLAWFFALAVLVFTLVLPLAGSRGLLGADPIPGVPTDALWTSGPLSMAHRTAGLDSDCGACHGDLFKMVEDGACTACHSGLHEHAEVDLYPSLDLAQVRCAACHREHNEPARLTRRDPPLCTACHAEPELWRRDGAATPEAVHAFTATEHPEFRIATWEPEGKGAALGWRRVRTRVEPAALEERSGLKFDHVVHLDPEKVRRQADDAALGCASCHEDAGDGEHFAPIAMDAHCRSCHSLNFDPFDPDRALPHGDTRAAFETMEAHFIREFSDPLLRAQRAREKPRRLPGKRMGAATCTGDALDCGRREAEREAAYQFADTGCVTCHEVIDTGAQAPIDRWFVHPVKLTADWYVESQFDHRAHLNLPDRSGDDTCTLCHAARDSTRAADVLMPTKTTCLDCHAAERAPAAVDCVSCHGFHRAAGTPTREARAGAAGGAKG